MRRFAFTKAHSCGNDFLIMEAAEAAADMPALARAICDRHAGIGADGVEWIAPASDGSHQIAARLINADGSEAELSGNGTRCVAAHHVFHHGGNRVTVMTGAGPKDCFLQQHSGLRFEFEMAMGEASIGALAPVAGWDGLQISIGNPHFVAVVPAFPEDWPAQGARIQAAHTHFPEGVNVEFVQVQDEHTVAVRFFERGAGVTSSSGTGSCAAAMATMHLGLTRSPVRVVAAGGAQRVRLEGRKLFLEGPAELIGTGEFWFAGA